MCRRGLVNKTALITDAGRGIGKAIAYRLAEEGYRVILLSRTLSELEKVLHDIRVLGGEGCAVVCDVSSQEDVNATVDALEPVDVLINNAGRSDNGSLAQMDDATWHSVINANVNSVYYMTKALLARNKLNKPGSIINIASAGGKQDVVYAAAYSASKHAVIGFTKALGFELAKQNITVNAVCPGFVDAEMNAVVQDDFAVDDEFRPDEVVGIVSYLASPHARGVTAQAMNVCSGLSNYY